MRAHKLIKLYPSLIIIICSIMILLAAYIYKSTPNKKVVKIIETRYLESDPSVIIRDTYEVKRKPGYTYSWGEVSNYNLHIKGTGRCEISLLIMANKRAFMHILNDKEVILKIDSEDVIDVMDYIRSLK